MPIISIVLNDALIEQVIMQLGCIFPLHLKLERIEWMHPKWDFFFVFLMQEKRTSGCPSSCAYVCAICYIYNIVCSKRTNTFSKKKRKSAGAIQLKL